MTLLIAERPSLPIVTIQIVVKAGSLQEPKDKAGLANLTAELLPLGTRNRTAPEINETIEFVGGTLHAYAVQDRATISLTVLKRDLNLGLELLSDVLLHPVFSDAEIERKTRQIKGDIREKREYPGSVAREVFAATLFGDHPYGRPVEGTEETLDSVTRDDLVEFHKHYYVPNNSMLIAAGDITLKEFQGYVNKYFRAWRRKELPTLQSSLGEPPSCPQLVMIDRAITQSHILWGHVGIERNNPDYYPLFVMHQILGGRGMTSRLMRTIRHERGWAYHVYSSPRAGLLPGSFVVGLQTKNETAAPAVTEIMNQVRAIVEAGVTEEELEETKGYLTGSFPLGIETNYDVVSLLGTIELYGLGMDYPDRYPEIIRAVTREDIQRVARKYLHPDKGTLVVVGDPDKTWFLEEDKRACQTGHH
ncbi:MAG: insulinase family protein [candidate division NC10 bacterium]|nr:insulinase family protein [candidate division NC10 bacterium]